MLLKIPGLMSKEQVADLRGLLVRAEFRDGRATGHPKLKNNLQIYAGASEVQEAVQRVTRALLTNRDFTGFAHPKQVTLLFNRYEPGMFYKDHMDAALTGGMRGQPVRTDLSFTVFLSEPEDYEGGAFVIRTNFGDLTVKEPAGTAICYPSNMLHRVEAVTAGTRWAAVGWLQSFIRDLDQRLILQALDKLRQQVTQESVDHPADEGFAQIRENLLRLWVDV